MAGYSGGAGGAQSSGAGDRDILTIALMALCGLLAVLLLVRFSYNLGYEKARQPPEKQDLALNWEWR